MLRRIELVSKSKVILSIITLFSILLTVVGGPDWRTAHSQTPPPETLAQIGARLSQESTAAYNQCPFSILSKDFFSRFSRNPEARIETGETEISSDWRIVVASPSTPLAGLMAGHLVEFLDPCMGVKVSVLSENPGNNTDPKRIRLAESGGGTPNVPGSFTLDVKDNLIEIKGMDPEGLRDGVVRLVHEMGLREAPFVLKGERSFSPRIPVRLGAIPHMGSYRDLVFMGYNAVFAGGGSLYALSTSDAIPELMERRSPGSLDANRAAVAEARRYGLKAFAFIDIRQKFPKDHPVFQNHPEIRGALTWKADGEYVLCTEHPLVKQYLTESVEGLFREVPGLEGITLIIGGEGFYHCYMRPFGVEKGHTNCTRCDPLGAETVVANLCNHLAEAARRVNPNALVVAWPYSAEHVWSKDKAQAALIEKLNPGTAIFTEMEKDEYVEKPEGVRKHLWDYSIDLIGPGKRAQQQIEACQARGIPIFLKSEPEISYEAPRLPHIPCMDRWADRAGALASCGASGAWVFPAFRPNYGSSASELNRFFWWNPVESKDEILNHFAQRLVGKAAGSHLRKAWALVSEAIPFSPELPSYYTGPYYLGPAQPMCADPKASLPEVFYGRYLFMAEMTDSEGVKLRPTFVTSPTGNVPVFGTMYRKMEALLGEAVNELEQAGPLVDERHQLNFRAESSSIRWFYHTARTEANFYESCQLRNRLLAIAEAGVPSGTPSIEAEQAWRRWREVLEDEQRNTQTALPVMEADMRLDFYFGGDHTFSHGSDMLKAKLEILQKEIHEFLPSIAVKLGIGDKKK
jgi:hypothetical protein